MALNIPVYDPNARTAEQKPSKGSGWQAMKDRSRDTRNHERTEKDKVRKRDKRRCRWPFCEYRADKPRIEVAHLDDKKMGGDHGLRTIANRMICLCFLHHQGAKSLHTGHREIVPQTTEGTDGICLFYDVENGVRVKAYGELAPGIPEPMEHD